MKKIEASKIVTTDKKIEEVEKIRVFGSQNEARKLSTNPNEKIEVNEENLSIENKKIENKKKSQRKKIESPIVNKKRFKLP